MRVTNSMIASRVVYNTQNSISRFLTLQTQMSTGKRINKPSDDPVGITRDINYRTELSNNKQYQGNVNLADSWYQINNTQILEIQQNIDDAKQAAISAANGASVGSDIRKTYAQTVKVALSNIFSAANTKTDSGHIYSGFMTDTPALQKHPNGMTFEGDENSIKYQIGSNVEMDVNMNGAELFFKQIMILGEGHDLDVGLNGTTLLADLHNGNGIDQTPGQIVIRDLNLGINTTVDLSGATSLDDAITQINNDLVLNGITNMTVRIADDNNSLLFEPTENGLVTGTTPLSNLNNGAGVNLDIGLLKITDGAGIDLDIDLSSASTILDVITQFNTQVTAGGIANVTIALNAAGTGFEINDTNGVPLNLKIEDLTSSSVAEQLGIAGQINPTLNGQDLNPKLDFVIEEFGGTTAEDLGILSSFNNNFIGVNLDAKLLATSNLSDLNNGLGLTGGEIVMHQGGDRATIDLSDSSLVTIQDLLDRFNNSGLDITASINADTRGIQVVNNDRYASFTIEDDGDGTASKDLGIYGSSDIIGSLIVLENAMENDDQDAIGRLLENLDLGFDHIGSNVAINGTKGAVIINTRSRLRTQEFMFISRISEIEDADLTKVITNLSILENNYQAALMASAKIIQPSLMNFLR